jgi:uncharacterized iron-regulated membrane protein
VVTEDAYIYCFKRRGFAENEEFDYTSIRQELPEVLKSEEPEVKEQEETKDEEEEEVPWKQEQEQVPEPASPPKTMTPEEEQAANDEAMARMLQNEYGGEVPNFNEVPYQQDDFQPACNMDFGNDEEMAMAPGADTDAVNMSDMHAKKNGT